MSHHRWIVAASFEEHKPTRGGRYGWMHFNGDGAVIDTGLPPAKLFEEPSPDAVAPGRIRTVGRDRSVPTTVPLPERKEPVHRILTDGTGLTWALLATTGSRIPDDELPKDMNGIPPIKWRERDRWAAFDRDGVLRFVVESSEGAQILDRAGRRLLGVTADANGVQSVVVWRVENRSP